MSDLIKERLRERVLDAQDWFEIRPDPHWWPAVAIPGVIALAYFTVPHNLFPFLLAGAIVLTIIAAVLAILGGLLFVVGRALRDVIDTRKSKLAETKPHVKVEPNLRRAYR